MNRECARRLIQSLADKNGYKYVEPDDDVLDMLVMFAELVEDRCHDKWFDFMVRMVDNINIK